MATVALTFDVDGEAGLACRPGSGWERRLTSVSEARFGVTRALPRILERLARHRVAATFFVPGATAERHSDAIRAVAAAGHELGHHGHRHLPTRSLYPAGEREEIERGLAALEACAGVRPAGYRSPGWELTPVTLELLREHGFAFDSSLMGDDRPYRLHDGGLVELPVHWSLDDVPYLAFDPDAPSRLGDPAAVLAAWTAELEAAEEHLTLTLHPEVIGRGARLRILDALLERVAHQSVLCSAACAAAR